ncbi:chromosome segregation protein SMC [Fodinisporobacter ferrooxydans]|uniref:Chromosome partition protein Smc n=1 Tax=Fodinisporobacter ferrooxydans TaxID=2901836 RepID=A0ABY4CFN9_9BACL|nr:chromosome segregation protein SMC [Alicyclobacillaceae bacterium MYW30-H2]
MYLKRMEITGFKSFADRTELEFVPGVTAVVGPNGSGKSNISDSIRWVLGEQSAKSLRGAKMEDVIFAGSDTRKPVNYCEVTLTLENSDRKLDLDYTEVTITRRVYRSGDSEYMINKQSCRLRDIHELFMDTGLGKEAYSVIGQGKIEEILSTKAEDRRGIFEEAAGIVKYKTRKKEAEKKLEETEGNLLRIGDIIGELEEQIQPLAEQAEVAQRFQILKEDLKVTEIGLYIYDINDLHEKWTQSKAEYQKFEQQQLDQAGRVNSLEADVTKSKWIAEQVEQRLEHLQQQHLEVVTEAEKVEGRKEVLIERQQNLLLGREEAVATIHRMQKEHGQLQATRMANEQKIDETRTTIQSLRAELLEKSNANDEMQARLKKEELLEASKSELIECLNQTAGRKNEKNHILQQSELFARRVEKFQKEQQELEQRFAALYEEFAESNDRLQQVNATIQHLEEQRQQGMLLLQQSQQQQRGFEQKLQQLQNQETSLRSRLDLLKDMQQEYGGYMQGVKTVLQAKDGVLSGVHGAVAELFSVDREYEVAVETALGGALQNIVVDDEKSGRAAIEYLKKKGGRATFMPLNVVKGRSLSNSDYEALRQEQGFIGVASQLVRTSPDYRGILENLLGQVILARTLVDANRLAKRIGYRYRIVTLEGDVVNPGGTMTGGSIQRKGTSLLGRSREIEELEQTLAAVGKQQQSVLQERQEFEQSVSEHATIATKTDEQLKHLHEQERIAATGIHEKKVELRNLEERKAATAMELEQSQKEWQALQAREQRVEQELAEITQKTDELQQHIQRLQNDLRKEQLAAEDKNEEITEVRVRLASHEQTELNLKQQNLELYERTLALEQELETKKQEYQGIEKRLSITKNELAAIQTEHEQLVKQKEASQSELDKGKEEKNQIARTIATQEHLAKEARLALKQFEQQMHQFEVRVNRLDVELTNVLNKLSEEYHLTYDMAKQRYQVPEQIEEAKQYVKRIRQQIEQLGDVNIGAIEEYARVKERYEFLSDQRTDLLEAKEKLYEVITEIDQEMSKRFHETFIAIREQFGVAFTQLFGGGRADLLLSNPDDILATGIDIVAQPPGKKLQNLALLSGGERALTAMALLFAILRVKPVPFCVLDEVEAALDEANVSRFAEYLREFSSKTQFIVITHRKGTMEGADVLYGVTMQESGVSKLISVKLTDQALETAS